MTTVETEIIKKKLAWQKEKLAMQRDPTNPDCTLNYPLLTGRTEGGIGMLEWVLRELNAK